MSNSSFVADGHRNAVEGIEAEVRPHVEEKYAAQWNASSYIRRWVLLRKIDREVAQIVNDRAPPNALY